MAGEVARLPKPQMRGLLRSSLTKHFVIATTLSVVWGVIFKMTIVDPRRRRYAEFYKNYDAEKEFETMRKKGVFQSC